MATGSAARLSNRAVVPLHSTRARPCGHLCRWYRFFHSCHTPVEHLRRRVETKIWLPQASGERHIYLLLPHKPEHHAGLQPQSKSEAQNQYRVGTARAFISRGWSLLGIPARTARRASTELESSCQARLLACHSTCSRRYVTRIDSNFMTTHFAHLALLMRHDRVRRFTHSHI